MHISDHFTSFSCQVLRKPKQVYRTNRQNPETQQMSRTSWQSRPKSAAGFFFGGGGGVVSNRSAVRNRSGRRTRRRGPTRRERTTRRTVSYKASGPDASGMYDASYSVVQGVVQHQHRTTQYDIVRPPSPSRRVNDGSGPSWGKGAFGPLPKYWHFASTTCRQCLQLAGRVYLWCTVSTDPRPPSPCAECCLIEGGGQSVA